MKSFEYVITYPATNPNDFPFKPIKELQTLVRTFQGSGFADDCTVTIHRGGTSANVLSLMSLVGMGLLRGDHITVTIEGENEAAAAPAVEEFFKANL